jgi:hypothetical protein
MISISILLCMNSSSNHCYKRIGSHKEDTVLEQTSEQRSEPTSEAVQRSVPEKVQTTEHWSEYLSESEEVQTTEHWLEPETE